MGPRRRRNSGEDGADCETDLPSAILHIEIPHIERVVLDELSARFDHIAHQDREHLVGIDRVIVIQIYLEQFALLRIHRRLEQLLRVHFAETFEALDLHAAATDLQNLMQNFGNRKKRMRNSFLTFALDQFEDGAIARGIVTDLQAFARELGHNFLDRGRLCGPAPPRAEVIPD